MKATIERSNLLTALNHVQSVVERRNTIPILSNVLVAAQDGTLALTATDLEIEIREKIEADIETPGIFAAPAHMFYDIVRRLPDGAQIEMHFDEAQKRFTVTSGAARFEMQTLASSDFPTMVPNDMPVTFALQAKDLLHLINKTRFAISSEETRYYLNGIYLHIIEAEVKPLLRAVATDGHRLAMTQITMPVGANNMPAIIVPRKTVAEIQKLVEEYEGEISVQISETKINFAFSHIVLTSKLIDGKFPDYTHVIPENNDKRLSVTATLLAQSVDRVSAISNEKSRAVKLALQENTLGFTVSSPESGMAQDTVQVEYQSDPVEIGFNARYLLDVAGQIGDKTAIIDLSDSGSPVIIREGDDDNVLYVLMPMRV